MILPPERKQIEDGIVPLEHVRGSLDVASTPVVDLLQYMAKHGIPLNTLITAGTFHDRPFLELTWEPPS